MTSHIKHTHNHSRSYIRHCIARRSASGASFLSHKLSGDATLSSQKYDLQEAIATWHASHHHVIRKKHGQTNKPHLQAKTYRNDSRPPMTTQRTRAKAKAAAAPPTDKQLLLQQQLKQFKQLLDSQLIEQAEYEQLKTSVCTNYLPMFQFKRDLYSRQRGFDHKNASLLYAHSIFCPMDSNTGISYFWLRCDQK